MFHLDAVAASLAQSDSQGDTIRTLGFLDSPYWVDVEPLYDTLTSLYVGREVTGQVGAQY